MTISPETQLCLPNEYHQFKAIFLYKPACPVYYAAIHLSVN